MESSSSSSSSSTFQSSLTRSGPQYGSLLSMPIHSNVAIRKPSRNDDHHDEKKTLLPTVVVDESADAPAPVVARDDRSTTTHRTFFRKLSSHFFPAQWDIIEVVVVPGTADVDMDMDMNNVWSSRSSSRSVDLPCNEQHRTTSRSKPKTNKVHRSMTRRFHLLLTEPDRYVTGGSLLTCFASFSWHHIASSHSHFQQLTRRSLCHVYDLLILLAPLPAPFSFSF